jgi:serine/threonine protein phosphatase PrpC
MPNDVASEPLETVAEQTRLDTSSGEMRAPPGLASLLEPLPDVIRQELAGGEAAWISIRSPAKSSANEDAVAAISIDSQRGLLLVADGLGGHREGRRASQLMRTRMMKAARQLAAAREPDSITISKVLEVPSQFREPVRDGDSRSAILDEIEWANQKLLRSRVGCATTLALVEIQRRRARSYHVGDSEILILSQRGRLKYSTVSHSPIGYALQSGMLTEEEAILHPDRHLVSNVVGSNQMSVELGPWIGLAPRDTVLLASDGLFDNLMQSEVIECIRKGRLADGVRDLAELARRRMTFPSPDAPSKPDDLTILAYRGGRGGSSSKSVFG